MTGRLFALGITFATTLAMVPFAGADEPAAPPAPPPAAASESWDQFGGGIPVNFFQLTGDFGEFAASYQHRIVPRLAIGFSLAYYPDFYGNVNGNSLLYGNSYMAWIPVRI